MTKVYSHNVPDAKRVQYDPETDAPYVDKTGTDKKPDPMRDVYLEFPLAMMEIAKVTAYGASKHAPRGWQTFDPEYGMDYHRSKVGRHLLKEELEGPVNHEDGDLLHPSQTAWNMLAYLEHFLRNQVVEVVNIPAEFTVERDRGTWYEDIKDEDGWWFWDDPADEANTRMHGPFATKPDAEREQSIRTVHGNIIGGTE